MATPQTHPNLRNSMASMGHWSNLRQQEVDIGSGVRGVRGEWSEWSEGSEWSEESERSERSEGSEWSERSEWSVGE